jgi:hypothetical protein
VRTISRDLFDVGAACRIDIEPETILVWPATAEGGS